MDDSSISTSRLRNHSTISCKDCRPQGLRHKRRFGQVELRFQRRPGRYGAGNLGEGEESSLLQRGSSSSLRPYACRRGACLQYSV